MPTLSEFFWFYLFGMLVVVVRFGWHMVFRLDHLDWHYGKSDIWFGYTTAVILWPFLIFRPRLLLDPSPSLEDTYGQAKRHTARIFSPMAMRPPTRC